MYLCFSGNGHEVGIPFPAWYQMQVDMSGNSCASNPSEVDPEVVPIWLESSVHGGLCISGGRHQFERFFRGQFFECSLVGVGGDHQVADIVRKPIENRETGISPMKNQVFPVLLFGDVGAEEAILIVVFLNVLHPPGCPNVIHCLKDTCAGGWDQTKANGYSSFRRDFARKKGAVIVSPFAPRNRISLRKRPSSSTTSSPSSRTRGFSER